MLVLLLSGCNPPTLTVDEAAVVDAVAIVAPEDDAATDVTTDAPADVTPPRPKLRCGNGIWRIHSLRPTFAPDAGCDRDTEVCCQTTRSNMCAPDRKSECTTLEACKGRAFACWNKSDCAPDEVCCAHKAVVECAPSCDKAMTVEIKG